jgi:uncharacterized protein YutE (UPF0331/DUF86 family)
MCVVICWRFAPRWPNSARTSNARRDLEALRRNGVLSGELTTRLQRLRELRRLLVHEYATATAEEIHESAQITVANFPAFYNAYRDWIKRGFAQALRKDA